MQRNKPIQTRTVHVGNVLIGSGHPIVVQTMCNTHTAAVDATVAQCLRLVKAGARIIRITVPSLSDVEALKAIRSRVPAEIPLVADIHFSADVALAVVPVVEKIRINPGNFHPRHELARERFKELLEKCKEYDRAIRIGINHGSLGRYIVEKYGNTPEAMALAAMEWIQMCVEASFYNVVVSLKASNTVVMVEAYRALVRLMQEAGTVFPLHVGVTEAGNGDSGRIKSCVAIATLLEEGIGNTIRVSLTEPPENEIPVAKYLADRYDGLLPDSGQDPLLKAACDWGPALLNHEIDDIPIEDQYLKDEILQACRRRFYKPEYIACPGCGRTLYDLESTFNKVKAATAGFKNIVIAVMGCIVNGPGEMADADYGYVGEGHGKVTRYRKKEPVLRHIPEDEAVEQLVRLIEASEQV